MSVAMCTRTDSFTVNNKIYTRAVIIFENISGNMTHQHRAIHFLIEGTNKRDVILNRQRKALSLYLSH